MLSSIDSAKINNTQDKKPYKALFSLMFIGFLVSFNPIRKLLVIMRSFGKLPLSKHGMTVPQLKGVYYL